MIPIVWVELSVVLALHEEHLDEPRVRDLVGEGKAARMAEHVRMGGNVESAASPYRRIGSHTVLRESGARRSLINSVLPSGCICSRSADFFLTALISSLRIGCVVDKLFFSRRTCSVRPSRSRSATVKLIASDTRNPCRNIRSNKHRSRVAFRLPWAATIRFSISRAVRCFRSSIILSNVWVFSGGLKP